jgi:6-phosphogluconolactonase
MEAGRPGDDNICWRNLVDYSSSRRQFLGRMMTFAASNALASTSVPSCASPPTFILYVGTYTGHGSNGIYAFRFRAADGNLQPLGLVAKAINPSALVLVPSIALRGSVHRLLAVRETSKASDGPNGAVLSYIIDQSSGALQFVDETPSHGDGPCSIALDESGRHVFVANFWGGSVAVLSLQEDGHFGKASAVVQNHGHSAHPQRQTSPHPHAFRTMPGNRFAVVADLGIDQLLVYRFDPGTGRIAPAEPPSFQTKAGSGPRHLTFSQDGRVLYVINEINCTVAVLSVNRSTGSLKLLQTIATMNDDETQPGDAAELLLHPNGRFLYVSTRRPSTIRLFQVEETSGFLTTICDFSTAGQSPATFAIDPSGRWLIAGNQNSNNLVLFPIDLSTGTLGPLHSSMSISTPVSLVFSPAL